MRKPILFTLMALAAFMSGCASTNSKKREPVVLTVTPAATQAPHLVEGRPAKLHEKFVLDENPEPIWHEAEIQEVKLEPYVNERGELMGEQKKWVVKKAGGWNRGAVLNPDRAYIPAENLPPIPDSEGYSSMSMSGTAAAPAYAEDQAAGDQVPLWGNCDPQDIHVTGLTERTPENQARAHAMCQPGQIEFWDSATHQYYIGPQTILTNTGVKARGAAGISSQRKSQAPKSTSKSDDDIK